MSPQSVICAIRPADVLAAAGAAALPGGLLPHLDGLCIGQVRCAGRAGARLAAVLGIAVHRSTLLALVAALPEAEISTAPGVLGVDDFAPRRGMSMGRS